MRTIPAMNAFEQTIVDAEMWRRHRRWKNVLRGVMMIMAFVLMIVGEDQTVKALALIALAVLIAGE